MSGRKRNESEGGLTLLENSRRDRRNWMDPWEHSRRLNREHPGDYYRRRMKLSQLEPTCSSNSRKIENWTRSRNILKLAAKIRGKMKWKEKWNELETIGSFGSIVSQRRGGGNETVRHFSEGWDFIEFGSEKKKKRVTRNLFFCIPWNRSSRIYCRTTYGLTFSGQLCPSLK